MAAMKLGRDVTAEASVSAASLPELRKTPSRSSRTVSRSPAVRPMKVESAGSWLIDAGTVTVVFIPIRSTATMAVKILVRLAGARAARALDCQRKRPVSRLTSVTSWAAMTGTGSGRNVAAGRGILVGSGVTVRTGDGTGVGVETGTRSGRGPSVISGMAAVTPSAV